MPVRVPVKDFIIYKPAVKVSDRMFEFGYTELSSGKSRRYIITAIPGRDLEFLRFWQIVSESAKKGKYAFNPWADERTRSEGLKNAVKVKTVVEDPDDGLSFDQNDDLDKNAQIDRMFDPANTLRAASTLRRIADTMDDTNVKAKELCDLGACCSMAEARRYVAAGAYERIKAKAEERNKKIEKENL